MAMTLESDKFWIAYEYDCEKNTSDRVKRAELL